GLIPTRHLLFPDAQLPQNVFFEDIRLFHEATTNGSIHTPGPRRPDLLANPTATNPNPMTGHTEPTAETFFKFNDDGTSLVPFQESLTDFWRDYAYGGSSRRVQGGEGPKYTIGSPTRNGQERDNIFANFRWEVSDDVTLNTRFTYGVTEGEQIRNAPRNNQMSMCIYTDVREGAPAVNIPPNSGLTPVPAVAFNPDALFQPGTGPNQQSAGAQYDGNPAYAGHFFQIQV